MSTTVPSTRRIAIAVGTAAASVTVALGMTAASVLGWFKAETAPPVVAEPAPAPAAPATPSSVILVPVAPTPALAPAIESVGDVQLAVDEARDRRWRDDDDDRERSKHHRDHDDEGDDDDD